MNKENRMPAVRDLLKLDGQCALVTGGSGNIGRGIAMRLAEAGADVVVHYQSDVDGAEKTVAAVRDLGRNAVAMQADLGDAEETAAMFRSLDEDGTPPTCVVNNAGGYPVQQFAEMTAIEWRAVTAANLDSAVHVSQESIRRWCSESLGGTIVNVASIEGTDPALGHSHYASSKAGLLMLTRAIALEYGRQGIRVNAVSPGLIYREGIETDWPEGVASWHEHAPLERMGDSMDVADAVLFLLSPASRWVSGINLVVDGGMSCASRW